MIAFSGHAVLLDIEGTTSSISFVYDVMFPFARRELDNYLQDQWGTSTLIPVTERLAQDVGFDSMDAWILATAGEIPARQLVRDTVIGLMDGDIKARENTGNLIDKRGEKAFRFVLLVQSS